MHWSCCQVSSTGTWSQRTCCAWGRSWSRSQTLAWPERSAPGLRIPTTSPPDGNGAPLCNTTFFMHTQYILFYLKPVGCKAQGMLCYFIHSKKVSYRKQAVRRHLFCVWGEFYKWSVIWFAHGSMLVLSLPLSPSPSLAPSLSAGTVLQRCCSGPPPTALPSTCGRWAASWPNCTPSDLCSLATARWTRSLRSARSWAPSRRWGSQRWLWYAHAFEKWKTEAKVKRKVSCS